jgi:hypothetical protein
MKRYRLYCGLSSPKRSDITEQEYQSFLRDHVTPSFAGFTSYNAEGFWLGKSENTRIIEVLSDEDERSKVDALAELYATKFAQDCVMVTEEQVTSSFVSPRSEVLAA